MLSENVETEDVANIISLAQSVMADNGIKWGNIDIHSGFCMLVNLLSSSDLNQGKRENIVKLMTKFVDKLQLNDSDLVATVFGVLYMLHRVILFDKHHPPDLQAKQCMDLVGNLLKKIVDGV